MIVLARYLLWRLVLALTGGLVVTGVLPSGPCVVVANHSSHADTPALLAALGARRSVAVAAAADHWFARPLRSIACRLLVGGFPVRRDGGGGADLTAASWILLSGGIVVVYPEGTRSRGGDLGHFHSGAARLAAHAGVPMIPAAVSGTRSLCPPDGGPRRRRRVRVRFGTPLDTTADPRVVAERSRSAVATLLAGPAASTARPR
ncbi:lysophospholipid acyltransferase family protein [Lipingzhangella sp. LS1_29]|uniref:Lysophospholipid acyltransferase family protein n=1 Tax=Lipingzhangella rawalii TaxID=2055835 RepID=A0ABU2H3U0_9ACTN|nr:lysophospholipid acyltransferase family protein [Lipingzhangella rawalii]MDS1269514.1 lysophospholipid acyltransferase family protein [Lipingzhangella rawalii]